MKKLLCAACVVPLCLSALTPATADDEELVPGLLLNTIDSLQTAAEENPRMPRDTQAILTLPPTAAPTNTPVAERDTEGPKVNGAKAIPNPALTTSLVTISAKISDSSGVASAEVYYKRGKSAYQSAGAMNSDADNHYTLEIGPLTPAGTYQFRILAIDGQGNANCRDKNPDSCPGGSFQVVIP